MSMMKPPHRDELAAAGVPPSRFGTSLPVDMQIGQPGLPLDITGVVPPVPEITLPDGRKVTFKVYRTLSIALRNNPSCFKVTGEDTEEWRDQIAMVAHLWSQTRSRDALQPHPTCTIVGKYGNTTEVLSVDLVDVVLMLESTTC